MTRYQRNTSKERNTSKDRNKNHDNAILIKVDHDQSHESGLSIKEKKDKQNNNIKNKIQKKYKPGRVISFHFHHPQAPKLIMITKQAYQLKKRKKK